MASGHSNLYLLSTISRIFVTTLEKERNIPRKETRNVSYGRNIGFNQELIIDMEYVCVCVK